MIVRNEAFEVKCVEQLRRFVLTLRISAREAALSRSWVLLVKNAQRSRAARLNINDLGRSCQSPEIVEALGVGNKRMIREMSGIG